jgi:hypothetical protein
MVIEFTASNNHRGFTWRQGFKADKLTKTFYKSDASAHTRFYVGFSFSFPSLQENILS